MQRTAVTIFARRRRALVLSLAPVAAALAGAAASATPISGLSTTDQTRGMPPAAFDVAATPLGTDKSSSAPRVGYLDRCGGAPSGGPPVKLPPWVNTGAGTWNQTAKAAVEGAVTWTPTFTAVRRGSQEILSGNGLPPESGTFPVAASDPAHAFNPDPGTISAHAIRLSLPYNPKRARSVSCERGAVGIASDGIPLLDGFDAGGNDAAAVEVQDRCHGHPNEIFGYHYHSLSPCLLTAASLRSATQVGWALDGFGIYVEFDGKGRLLTDAALDACHGRTSVVPWHGKRTRIYHYDMTEEFPYTVGCFRGTPSSFEGMTIPGATPGGSGPGAPPGPGGPGGGGPPPPPRNP